MISEKVGWQDLIDNLATNADTLDAYGKSYIDSTFADYALFNDVYDKAFVDTRLAGLFTYFDNYTRTTDLYTKTYIDALAATLNGYINNKANSASL